MQTQLTAAQARLREDVRRFLGEALPAGTAERVRLGYGATQAQQREWTRILDDRGWAAPNWPREHGGTGWSLVERHIFDLECRLAHAPVPSGFGFAMVGPAIIRFGTPAQQAAFLPRIRRADMEWCQGYSEPGAGSDLASLATRAVRDGDHYRVTGRKIWTSAAEHADWMFCLVRTDAGAKPQRGISFLLIDMRTPGITVEPLYAFNGKRLWNQVVLDDVIVPVAQRLGEENAGWTVAKRLLGDERIMVSRVAENRRMAGVVDRALRESADPDDAAIQRQRNELALRLAALESTSLRMLAEADTGATIGAEPSMLKLLGSTLVQDHDALLCELAGHHSIPLDSTLRAGGAIGPDWADMAASGRFHHRGYTIAGGTSEVQHNIIAQEVLGL